MTGIALPCWSGRREPGTRDCPAVADYSIAAEPTNPVAAAIGSVRGIHATLEVPPAEASAQRQRPSGEARRGPWPES